VRVGKAFLVQLLNESDSARQFLSSTAISEIKSKCPSGSLIKCASAPVDASWGVPRMIRFVYGHLDAYLYYVWWTNRPDPLAIVIIVKKENNGLFVQQWRGFITAERNSDLSDLMNGTRHENEFP
jgi:hypothetical protein